jgi:alpha-L-rhamnosidase
MRTKIIVLIISVIFISWKENKNPFSPENLKCEYLVNPIGIDVRNPRFIWQMNVNRQGASQKAFMIFVGTDSAEVASGKGNVWESGTINSNLMPVKYSGQNLEPFTRYFWGAKIQDEEGNWSDLSKVVFWETGMMGIENWKGGWITDSPDYNIKPAPYFRKTFQVQKKIKSARVYLAVGGLYELYLNGEKIGTQVLDPMFTRYDRRLLYVTHDVTKSIQNGENIIGVLLGNGWFNYQSLFRFNQSPWRARPKFCMDLRITYEDGSLEVVKTGPDWKTALSPIIFNSIYTGEHYDARLEKMGWNIPGYDDSTWKKIFLVGAPTQNIEAQALHPIRITEEVPAKTMVKQDANTWLFDFGKNFSGVSRIKVSGFSGTIIRLKHAERLDSTGRADQSNVDIFNQSMGGLDPFQTDIFILSGNGEETFMPRFNYKGFQYVEVTADKPINLTKESLTGYFMHSDVPMAGEIQSSNPTLNKLWKAANASYLSNLFGYLTDCPTREKNGWTNDAHVSIETGLFNLDCITIFEKWLVDFKYEQQANGVLPAIVPTTDGYGYNWGNGVDLTSSIAIIPWEIYLYYGDSRLLESCYGTIKRYVDHIDDISPSGLTDWGLGDWTPIKSKAPVEFTSSTYFFIDAVILAKAAKLLDKQSDFEKYTILSEKIKNAINKKYLNREAGIYGSGLQTELSMALVWGLVPGELTEKVAGNLSKRVMADNSHIDVGELGTRTILNALSENGYSDLAYKAALQETYPAWGWWIANGATTLYEYWILGDKKSMNHHMFGEISAWFYNCLGGIYPDEDNPGFKNVILKPNFVEGLDQFSSKHTGPYGTIISSWKKSGRKILYDVTIPPNSIAKLYLNSKEVLENGKDLSANNQIKTEKANNQASRIYLKSGSYHFSIRK